MLKKLSEVNRNRLAVADSIEKGPFDITAWGSCIAGHCHKVQHGAELSRGPCIVDTIWVQEAVDFLGLAYPEAMELFTVYDTQNPPLASDSARRLRELVTDSAE